MNLDKLKDLEAKATPGEWVQKDDPDHPNSMVLSADTVTYITDCEDNDAYLIVALRNSAKEMISTIERYKAALEEARGILMISGPSREAITVMETALKDPEKTSTF